jgi:glycerol-3-phosphate dehydrogenase (NAD(P)+)
MMENRRQPVGVVGAGRWGTTLAELAAQRGYPVVLFAGDAGLAARLNEERANPTHLPELPRMHDGIRATADLPELAGRCHLLLVAVPAAQVRPLVRRLGESLDGSHVVVHAIRGLEPTTLASPSRIVVEETCARRVGALLGPVIVESLLSRVPTAAVVASRFPEVIAQTREVLGGDFLRIYGNPDLWGVEVASAAASVVALSLGVALELGLGAATVALLATRGLSEAARLCAAVGGKADTIFGLAGLGDLLVQRETESREIAAGRNLARGKRPTEIEAEGVAVEALEAVRTTYHLAQRHHVDTRLTAAMYGIVQGEISVAEAMDRLMSRQRLSE